MRKRSVKRRPRRTRRFHKRSRGPLNPKGLFGSPTPQRHLIVSDRQYVKVRYVEPTSPTIAIGIGTNFAVGFLSFNLNGLYDVNDAVASTSVPGMAEWGAFYRFYRVWGAMVKITVVNGSTTEAGEIVTIAYPPAANLVNPASWLQVKELLGNTLSRSIIVGPSTGEGVHTRKAYYSMPKMFGNKIAYEADGNFEGAINTTNPNNVAKYRVYAITPGGSLAVANIPLAMELTFTFYVELFGRNTLFA